MQTKSQVSTLIVDEFLAQCRTADVSGTYHAMIARAREIVLTPHQIELLEDRTARVRSATQPDVWYHVNGQCNCPSAQHDAKGICKHRIAAKAYRHLQTCLEAIEATGQVHTHRYVCGHSAGRLPCYEVDCPDRDELVLCPVCAAGEAETPAEAPEDLATAGEVAQHAPEVGRSQTTAYEPNPSHQHVCSVCGQLYACWGATCAGTERAGRRCLACIDQRSTDMRAPLPEAPCSVNVYLCIQGRRVQVTLRGTDEAEVLARLTCVLAQHPAPAYEGK